MFRAKDRLYFYLGTSNSHWFPDPLGTWSQKNRSVIECFYKYIYLNVNYSQFNTAVLVFPVFLEDRIASSNGYCSFFSKVNPFLPLAVACKSAHIQWQSSCGVWALLAYIHIPYSLCTFSGIQRCSLNLVMQLSRRHLSGKGVTKHWFTAKLQLSTLVLETPRDDEIDLCAGKGRNLLHLQV